MRKPPHFIIRRWLKPEEHFTLKNGSHNERFKNLITSFQVHVKIQHGSWQQSGSQLCRSCHRPDDHAGEAVLRLWFTAGWPMWRDVRTSIPAVTVSSFARRLILSSAAITQQASLKGQLVLPPLWYVCCTDLSHTHRVCSPIIKKNNQQKTTKTLSMFWLDFSCTELIFWAHI